MNIRAIWDQFEKIVSDCHIIVLGQRVEEKEKQWNLWWLDIIRSPSLSRSSSSRSRFRRRATPTTTTDDFFPKIFPTDFFSRTNWRSTSLRYYTSVWVFFKQQVFSYVFEEVFSYLFLLDPVVGNLFNCFFELLFRGNPAKTFLLQENNNRTITGKSTNRIGVFFNIYRLGWVLVSRFLSRNLWLTCHLYRSNFPNLKHHPGCSSSNYTLSKTIVI